MTESKDREVNVQSATDGRAEYNAKCAAFSELLFVILPFIVIAIALGHRGELHRILFIPEWSIVSAVIIGQSIVKLISSVLGRKIQVERIVFVISLLLVCLLIPCLIVLALVLTADQVSRSLAVTQAIIFVIGATTFWSVTYLNSMFRHQMMVPEAGSIKGDVKRKHLSVR